MLYSAQGNNERNRISNKSTHGASPKSNYKNVLLNECLETRPPLQNLI